MMHILAAIDLTPESKIVLAAAGALAKTMGARVRLVHVVVPSAPCAPMPGMIPATGVDPVPGLVARAQERLESMERELEAGRSEGSAVEVGPVADTLLRAADEEGADLVVIGAHGHGAVARVLGTKAARIVNRAHASVLVVRRSPVDGSPGAALLRILAAVDFSDAAEAVIARATELAHSPGARVRILRVEPYLDQIPRPLGQNASDSAEELRRMDAEIPVERRDGITIVRGEPAAEIRAFAKEYCADIVVIGAHAYGWTERVLGTIAAAVVDGIDRPLLVVREMKGDHSRVELFARHAGIRRLGRSLVDSFSMGDWSDMRAEWAVFEPSIRAHMIFEERLYFRRFSAAYPAYPEDATTLEAQHVELRAQLDRFAVAIELHSVGQHDAEDLIVLIRRHAAREEEVFWQGSPASVRNMRRHASAAPSEFVLGSR